MRYKGYKFDYSKEKDAILKKARGIGFEDIINAIRLDGLLEDKEHPNKKKYPGQRLFIVKLKDYIYSVPYIYDRERKVNFLKTLYPSRKLTKTYLKNEKKKV